MTVLFGMCSPRDQMARAVAVAGAEQARVPNLRLDNSARSTILFGLRFSVNISLMKIPNTRTTLHVSMVYAFTRIYSRNPSPLLWRHFLGGDLQDLGRS